MIMSVGIYVSRFLSLYIGLCEWVQRKLLGKTIDRIHLIIKFPGAIYSSIERVKT